MSNVLAVDIGNTNIGIGLFRGERLVARYSIPTDARKGVLRRRLGSIVSRHRALNAAIASVVPDATREVARALKRILPGRVYIIGSDLKVPLVNRYRNPRQVGQDRLVNAFAGVSLYGAPLIVVDFGTAVTFDAVSGDAEYLGGMILPGFGISLAALSERTALLPRVRLRRPRELIGRDTQSSILSGMVRGYAALVEGLVKEIKTVIGRKAFVVCTGGDAEVIAPFCRAIDKTESALTLKGIHLLLSA